jgi:ABC-type polar amino acid transport system ATPase subunit
MGGKWNLRSASAKMNEKEVEVVGLSKSFNSLRVLSGLQFSVSKGEVVALIGPSGSGKTTLLRCLNLLEIPDSGVIKIGGQVLYDEGVPRHTDLSLVRQRIGMVFQQLHLWPHKTVLGNIIEAPIATKKFPRHAAIEKARGLLEEMKLVDKQNEFPFNLSGGQQQRVAICRALIMEPDVILFDEITSALDPEIVGDVLEVMSELATKGQTMIVVTHEMIFARDVAHRVLFLDNGQFIEEGRPGEVLLNPRHERTREFLSRVIYSKQIGGLK